MAIAIYTRRPDGGITYQGVTSRFEREPDAVRHWGGTWTNTPVKEEPEGLRHGILRWYGPVAIGDYRKPEGEL